jgi:arylamine N-acetyltransferase
MESIFSNEEIDLYLQYLELPPTASKAPRGYEFLNTIHIHQISKVPFENLGIHYSKAHDLDVNPRAVYQQVMSGNGRGGQCMQLNILLSHILRGLGFQCYTTGGRARLRVNGIPQGNYMGL